VTVQPLAPDAAGSLMPATGAAQRIAPPTAAFGKLLAQADRLTARGRQVWTFLAPGPGRLTLTVTRGGRTLARGSALAVRGGLLLRVRTKMTAAGRRALADLRRQVVVKAAFTPAGSTKPFVERRRVRL
jgi:hypothetical protein